MKSRMVTSEETRSISDAIVPADIFEVIWTRDIVDHEWNILRLRRISAGLISATQQQAPERIGAGIEQRKIAVERHQGLALFARNVRHLVH